MAEIGYCAALEKPWENFPWRFESSTHRPRPKMFIYKKKIIFEALEKELNKLLEIIETLNFPQGFSEYILYTISEISDNIKEHSLAKNIFINIKINRKQSKIEFRDDGIGFRNSYLKKKIYPKDDFSAIEFALSGLSTKDLQERGFGIYSIKKLVEVLKGKLTIETGLARAIIERKRIDFQKISHKRSGVKIKVEAPIRKINFYQIIK